MQVFGNDIDEAKWRSCRRKRDRQARKFNYDPSEYFEYYCEPDYFLKDSLGVMRLKHGPGAAPIDYGKAVVLGTIRMGYGHLRMSLAAASAARSMGYTPYWLDFISIKESTASRVIGHLNYWYTIGSRLTQKSKPFNYLWEKATSEWSRPITYYAENVALTELYRNVCDSLPKDIPYIASHAWCAQAAVHSGMRNVVDMIPDNWPLSFHLAEGSVMAIQSVSSFIGYRELRNMGPKGQILKPIPEGMIRYTGHYIDHEIVSNVDADCDRRLRRMAAKKPRRILMTIGGAGAQEGIFEGVIKYLLPMARRKEILLCVNMGDHKAIYDTLIRNLNLKPGQDYTLHSDWDETKTLAARLLDGDESGLHIFLFEEIMPAIYATNLLMRAVDVLMTKPSELAFYPVPKLFVQRVGRFEAWGAIRGAEIGDGTIETETLEKLYQTLKLLIFEDDLLRLYCQNIKKNKSIGIYDGAYNLIKIIEERAQAGNK